MALSRHPSRRIATLVRLLGTAVAAAATGAGLVDVLGGSSRLVAITAALCSLIVLLVQAILALGRGREAEDALLARSPSQVRQVIASEVAAYDLGVETEHRAVLRSVLGEDVKHAPYVERDVDAAELRPALVRAAGIVGSSLVWVAGPSKAGKSRTLFEAMAAVLPEAWLMVPRDARALAVLARGPAPRGLGSGPCVVWLDDAEPFIGFGDQGLSPETLASFNRWRRPVVVLATQGGKGLERMAEEAAVFGDAAAELLRRYPPIRLRPELSDAERERLTARYSASAAMKIAAIGEFMIAADQLVARYENVRASPEGVAIVRAAVDWRRGGLLRPIPMDALQELYTSYLSGPATQERFLRGLEWATTPLYATIALLQGKTDFQAYDYIVGHENRNIPVEAWDILVRRALPTESVDVSIQAYLNHETAISQRAMRRAAESLSDNDDVATHLSMGAALSVVGAVETAEEVYRGAERRGSAEAAARIGELLRARGELDEAVAAYRRAVEHGYPDARVSLGQVLHVQGNSDEALAVFRQLEQDGDPWGAYWQGWYLLVDDKPAEAEGHLKRAASSPNESCASSAKTMLAELTRNAGL